MTNLHIGVNERLGKGVIWWTYDQDEHDIPYGYKILQTFWCESPARAMMAWTMSRIAETGKRGSKFDASRRIHARYEEATGDEMHPFRPLSPHTWMHFSATEDYVQNAIRYFKTHEFRQVPLSDRIKKTVLDKSGGRCWYCGCELEAIGKWDVCRQFPFSRGGDDSLDNMAPACIGCSRSKSHRTNEEFRPNFSRRELAKEVGGTLYTEEQAKWLKDNYGVEVPVMDISSREFWYEKEGKA